ncbi:MAG: LPS export ABC transporter permease LptG [Alphaproteobacteria bacterium]|nr:LPS export ABC transporter permease LptG [Alphaproteobacteria bacterium]
MRLSSTLSLYISRQFLVWLGIVFALFVVTAFIFDAVELLRRASGANRESATFMVLIEMAVLRVPFIASNVLPFAALIGAILTLTRMTRTQELVVTRAAGVSVWQFLLPALAISFLLGAFAVTVFNPFAAAMVSRFEQMEARYLQGKSSLLALSDTGIWLRQSDGERPTVIHARRLDKETLTLHDVIIFQYEKDDQFVRRIDAREAKLSEGYWQIPNALMTGPDQPAATATDYRLATELSLEQIENSFAPPETLSFWALPEFIKVLEDSGFSSVRHRQYWHATLAIPLLLCAMVMIGATFSLRLNRRGGVWLLVVAGIMTGFMLYFVSDLVLALGLSGKIPPWLAAWAPSGVFMLIGIASLFHLEDG